tara:strand:+ start:47 stop:190 length:144 start_codon:yes stop_codon:yes gene_type:complete
LDPKNNFNLPKQEVIPIPMYLKIKKNLITTTNISIIRIDKTNDVLKK